MNAQSSQQRLNARRLLLLGFRTKIVEDLTNLSASQTRTLKDEIARRSSFEIPVQHGPVKSVAWLVENGARFLHASLLMNIYCSKHPLASKRVDIEALIQSYSTYIKEVSAIKARFPRASEMETLTMTNAHELAISLRTNDEDYSAEMRLCKSCYTNYYHVFEQERTLTCPFCNWKVRGVEP